MLHWIEIYYSLIFIILAVIIIWGFVLFVKIAKRIIKALDLYIEKTQKINCAIEKAEDDI